MPGLRYTPLTGGLLPGKGLVVGLALGGWGTAIFVVVALPVSPTAQAVFYAAGFAALAGSWALIRELYQARRMQSESTNLPTAIAFLGSGMRFALTVEFGLWLQSLRMLTPVYIVLLVISYLILEYLFRAAESRTS